MSDDSGSAYKGILALSFGIVALILNYATTNLWGAIPVGAMTITGFILGVCALKDPKENRGIAIAGIVICSVLALFFVIGFFIGIGMGLQQQAV
jgi:membrane associated rhomboid family serine protease